MKNIEIAIRNLKRNFAKTTIIIVSLSLGFSCLNLITTFLSHELRTDDFHADKDRIYALMSDNPFHEGQKTYNFTKDAEEYITNNFPNVEAFCTYEHSYSSFSAILIDNKKVPNELKILDASSNFFNFFSYPLLLGDPKSVLESGNSIVISDKLALKFFGTEFPIGKTIEFEKSSKKYPYKITGIFKTTNQNSQLTFDMVVGMEKERYRRGYVKLVHSANASEVQNMFAKYKSKIPILDNRTQGQYYLQPLKETYFDTSRILEVENSQSKTTIWIVALVGLIIMLLAIFNLLGIINYNLLERAKSYSIYKLNGASRVQLIKAISVETFLLLATSFLISLILMKWILPIFNRLINTALNFEYTFQLTNLGLISFILLAAFIIVLLFVIIKLNSITGYKVLYEIKTNRKFHIPSLNVFQLSITILLIVSSVTIIKQIQFIDNRAIGIDKKVIYLSVPPTSRDKLGVFKSRLLQFPTILNASITTYSVFKTPNMLLKYNEGGEIHSITSARFIADEDFVKTLGIKIIKGEDFSSDQLENRSFCLINESMAKSLSENNVIGSKLPDNSLTIIGVVEDFNYKSLRSAVSPAIIQWIGTNRLYLETSSKILIKTSDNCGEESIGNIKHIWNDVFPDVPFELITIGQQYQILHADNNKTIQLVILCCFISILLSMMGLFSVVLQSSKLRIKEIGIRKVNGAKISEILAMLNKDFIKWVAIAFILAIPIGYYAMHKWLENFAYKTSLSWWIFALAGILALGIALLTVSFQSWKAATRNPVEALRYE